MRVIRRVIALVLVISFGLGHAPALARPRADVVRARRAYEHGLDLFNQGRYSEALASFMQAYAIKPAPGLLYAAALAASKGNQLQRARGLLRRYLAKPPPAATHSQEIAKARELLADVERQLPGQLVVRTTPPGARVFVDVSTMGALGTTPFRGPVLKGEHTVLLSLEGYVPERRVVTIRPGEELVLDVRLRKNVGKLEVRAKVPGAEVLIDGRRAGRTPLLVDLPVGDHRVEVISPGMRRYRTTASIVFGETQVITARLLPRGTGPGEANAEIVDEPARPSRSRSLRPYFWTTLGLSLGALAAGGAMYALARQRIGALEQASGEFAGANAQLEAEGRTFGRAAIGLLAAGGVVGIAAGVLLALEPRRSESSERRRAPTSFWLVPAVGPGGGGLSAGARFGR